MSVALLVHTWCWAASRGCCFASRGCCPLCALLTGTAVATVVAHGVCLTTVCTRLAKSVLAPVSLMVCLLLLCTSRQDGRCSDFVYGMFSTILCWLVGMAIILVLLMVCLPSSCVARRDSHCSRFCSWRVCPLFVCGSLGQALPRFAHGVFAAIMCWLAGTAIVLVFAIVGPLFICRRALLWFCSWCISLLLVRLAGTGVAFASLIILAPFYVMLTVSTVTRVSLMVRFPPFLRGLTGTAIAPVLIIVRLPLFTCGRQDSHCSGFACSAFPFSCTACQDGQCSRFAHGVVLLLCVTPGQPLLWFRS